MFRLQTQSPPPPPSSCDAGEFLDILHSSGGKCTACSNSTCPAGEFRKGTCSGVTDGFSCHACSNTSCSDLFYRSGACEGDQDHYVCNGCAHNCDTGEYRSGCGGTSPGSCANCSNAPTNTKYTAQGSINQNNCAWKCSPNFYHANSKCVSCSNQSCASGKYRTGKCSHSSGNGYKCNYCASNCKIGEYRNNCSGTSAGSCVNCSNKPDNSEYSGQGSINMNNCAWKCEPNFYQKSGKCLSCSNQVCAAGKYRTGSCGHGVGNKFKCKTCAKNCAPWQYRKGCSGTSAGSCVSCTNSLPANSAYSVQGPVNSNKCGWLCKPGYFKSGNTCGQCGNANCPSGQYRTGSCSHSAGNGFKCINCPRNCPIGQYRYSCGNTSFGACRACRNPKPANSKYSTQGLVNQGNCGWTCNAGFYKSGNRCLACSNSSCPAGTYRTGTCNSSVGNGFKCNSCKKNCGKGKYRNGCSGTSAGSCTNCTNISGTKFKYTGEGNPNKNDCSYECTKKCSSVTSLTLNKKTCRCEGVAQCPAGWRKVTLRPQKITLGRIRGRRGWERRPPCSELKVIAGMSPGTARCEKVTNRCPKHWFQWCDDRRRRVQGFLDAIETVSQSEAEDEDVQEPVRRKRRRSILGGGRRSGPPPPPPPTPCPWHNQVTQSYYKLLGTNWNHECYCSYPHDDRHRH